MASKTTSKFKSGVDTKNIKMDSSETPFVALSKAAKKSALDEDSDSLYYEKGLQLSDEQLNEVKNETKVLNKVDDDLGHKFSISSIRKTKTAANTLPNTSVKKEISNGEESSSKVPTPVKSVKEHVAVEASQVNLNTATDGGEASTEENKMECNNVIRLASKNISDDERRKLRAKRFNIIVADFSQDAEKDSTPGYRTAFNPANCPTPTYDILKKRAERFGENVSTVMKSLDLKEKLLKRKLKFLESVTNLKELVNNDISQTTGTRKLKLTGNKEEKS